MQAAGTPKGRASSGSVKRGIERDIVEVLYGRGDRRIRRLARYLALLLPLLLRHSTMVHRHASCMRSLKADRVGSNTFYDTLEPHALLVSLRR
jgi:hypothetical protein